MYCFKRPSPNEWNVVVVSFFRLFPATLRILSLISFAALFVNVKAKISSSLIEEESILAMRYVIIRVLPLPAPAIISNGPDSVDAA